jgi:hypothetical protein
LFVNFVKNGISHKGRYSLCLLWSQMHIEDVAIRQDGVQVFDKSAVTSVETVKVFPPRLGM